jgi:hypothetical protein
MKRIKGTLHEDQYAFMIMSRSVLLRMGNVPEKVVEKIKFNVFYFSKIVPFMR